MESCGFKSHWMGWGQTKYDLEFMTAAGVLCTEFGQKGVGLMLDW